MRAMRVLKVVVRARTREPVLVLGEVDGDRCLPVFLRAPQAEVIAFGPRGEDDPLMTQDLIVPIVTSLGRTIEGLEITELRDGTFYADLVFDQGVRVGVRPSDGLAVAVRDGLPIAVDDAILDEVGQLTAEVFPNDTEVSADEQLREFREFIDEVSPEDFGDTAR